MGEEGVMNSYGFVMVDRALLNRPEVRELSGPAFKTLVYLMAKHTGENNGQLPFSCREAGRLNGVTKQHGSNLLKELQSAGLIEVARKATFDWKHGARTGAATTWTIRHLPKKPPPRPAVVTLDGEVVKPGG
jgi:hypothetical protein